MQPQCMGAANKKRLPLAVRPGSRSKFNSSGMVCFIVCTTSKLTYKTAGLAIPDNSCDSAVLRLWGGYGVTVYACDNLSL